MKKITWTAKNNSSFLNGRREAKTELGAVRSARKYVENEIGGEGTIYYFKGYDETPFRTDSKTIFTGFKWSTDSI